MKIIVELLNNMGDISSHYTKKLLSILSKYNLEEKYLINYQFISANACGTKAWEEVKNKEVLKKYYIIDIDIEGLFLLKKKLQKKVLIGHDWFCTEENRIEPVEYPILIIPLSSIEDWLAAYIQMDRIKYSK